MRVARPLDDEHVLACLYFVTIKRLFVFSLSLTLDEHTSAQVLMSTRARNIDRHFVVAQLPLVVQCNLKLTKHTKQKLFLLFPPNAEMKRNANRKPSRTREMCT